MGDRRMLATLALATVLAACGDRAVTQDPDPLPDGGLDAARLEMGSLDSTAPEAAPPDLDRPEPPPDAQQVDPLDFVISRILLPSVATAKSVGVDYDGDGVIDNGLGVALGNLAQVSPLLNIQPSVDQQLNGGDLLILLSVKAMNLFNAPLAVLDVQYAQPQQCCASASSPQACSQQAKQTCFSGSHAFTIDPTAPPTTELAGFIEEGRLQVGPQDMPLKLPFTAGAPLKLNLKQVYIIGDLTTDASTGVDRITGGIIAGALTEGEIQGTLLPAVAQQLNAILMDPGRDPATKSLLLSLLDQNNDGSISVQELAGNSLVKQFLAGDVDVDHDGVMELSFGLGMEAVGAIIQP